MKHILQFEQTFKLQKVTDNKILIKSFKLATLQTHIFFPYHEVVTQIYSTKISFLKILKLVNWIVCPLQ